MSALITRVLWFVVLAIVLAYATYLVAGSVVHAQASGENDPVPIRDELSAGTHHLSGMVLVPTPCDELSVRVEAVSDTVFALRFTTWREPSVTCNDDAVPRYFRSVLFAPSTGIEIIATLDGAGLPIVVLPALAGKAVLDFNTL